MASSWTVQELIDRRMTLHAYCHRSTCHHNKKVDLELLRLKLGPFTPAMADDLASKLRCTKCGGMDVGLTYSPDTSPVGGHLVSPYGQAKDGR